MDVDFTNSNGKNMQASVKDAMHGEKLLDLIIGKGFETY